MTVALYMDEHVHRAITTSLRLRGVDVLTAQDDGRRQLLDLFNQARGVVAGDEGEVLVAGDVLQQRNQLSRIRSTVALELQLKFFIKFSNPQSEIRNSL